MIDYIFRVLRLLSLCESLKKEKRDFSAYRVIVFSLIQKIRAIDTEHASLVELNARYNKLFKKSRENYHELKKILVRDKTVYSRKDFLNALARERLAYYLVSHKREN